MEHKRKLGEILVGSSYVSEADLSGALGRQPVGVRLGQYLMELGKISEDELYEALSLQQSLPVGRLEPSGQQKSGAGLAASCGSRLESTAVSNIVRKHLFGQPRNSNRRAESRAARFHAPLGTVSTGDPGEF